MDFFFFNDTATTEIYTLSLHDALPISNFCIANATNQQVFRIERIDRDHANSAGHTASLGRCQQLPGATCVFAVRSEEHTSELQSQSNLVCRLLLEKKQTTAAPRATLIA